MFAPAARFLSPKPLLVCAVMVLGAAAAGDAQESSTVLRNPISTPGAPWGFDGFVVNIPADDGWYSLAKDTHYAMLVKDFSADVEAYAIIDAHRVDEDVKTAAQLLGLLRKEQGAPADAAAMKLINYSAEPFRTTGASCVRILATFDDHRARYAAPGVLTVRGAGCVRPDVPDWVVTVKYTQRRALSDLLPELSRVAEPYVASLRISNADPSVMRNARTAVGQTP